jgi:3-methyladenine DNA glycosylase AlkC
MVWPILSLPGNVNSNVKMESIIENLSKIEHGFKPIETEAQKIFKSKTTRECLAISNELLKNDAYQVRSLAVFLLGYLASTTSSALEILKNEVSLDTSWQVQEILAKAFDQYCKDTGYEKALPVIKEWLSSKNPTVCRAVTEGLRIWTGRPYFKTNPQVAIQLISQHNGHESEYLRKSVGNSLRDISKKHKELVDKELSTWNLTDKRIQFTYKQVIKNK